MEKALIIYHNEDLDGYACGAIARYWCDKNKVEYKMLGLSHPVKEININFSDYSMIFLMDISLCEQDMIALSLLPKDNVMWIDHHVSAYNKFKDMFEIDDNYFYSPKMSACEIAVDAIIDKENKTESMASLFMMLGDYDIYRSFGTESWDDVYSFQCYADIHFGDPAIDDEYEKWVDTMTSFIMRWINIKDTFIEAGQVISKYQLKELKELSKKGKMMKINGENILNVFSTLNPDIRILNFFSGVDAIAFIGQDLNTMTTKVSLRKKKGAKIDILSHAIMNGGGGHECACGYSKPIEVC